MNHEWKLSCYFEPLIQLKGKEEYPIYVCNHCKIEAIGEDYVIWPIYENLTCNEIIIRNIIR